MSKHTFKVLRCSHRKIFKVCLAIFQHYMKGLILPFENNKFFEKVEKSFGNAIKKKLHYEFSKPF